jgi:hypothetical protein
VSRRKGIIATVRHPVDGGQPRYMPVITAQVRIFAPPTATHAQIEAALDEAVTQARTQIEASA